MDSGFLSFLRAFTAAWFDAMSGFLGVPLTIAATLWPDRPWAIALGFTGIACLVFASFRVWQRERKQVIALSPPRIRVRQIIGHRSADILETDEFILADGSGGQPIELRLPPAPKQGTRLEVKKGDNPNAASAVIISGNGNKIDGRDQYSMPFANQAIVLTFVSQNAGWNVT